MASHRRRPACGILGLALLGVVGCGKTSLVPTMDASADLSGLLPAPPCGGTGKVTGTTPTGPFNGDVISVRATYGGDTASGVTVGDSHTGAGITWFSSWMPPDGGADLPPSNGPVVATFSARNDTASWEVPGTVNVTAATNPAAASDAGQGGHVEETVAFSTSGFTFSGSLASPYCLIVSPVQSLE
jgi:hypothetical protein